MRQELSSSGMSFVCAGLRERKQLVQITFACATLFALLFSNVTLMLGCTSSPWHSRACSQGLLRKSQSLFVLLCLVLLRERAAAAIFTKEMSCPTLEASALTSTSVPHPLARVHRNRGCYGHLSKSNAGQLATAQTPTPDVGSQIPGLQNSLARIPPRRWAQREGARALSGRTPGQGRHAS